MTTTENFSTGYRASTTPSRHSGSSHPRRIVLLLTLATTATLTTSCSTRRAAWQEARATYCSGLIAARAGIKMDFESGAAGLVKPAEGANSADAPTWKDGCERSLELVREILVTLGRLEGSVRTINGIRPEKVATMDGPDESVTAIRKALAGTPDCHADPEHLGYRDGVISTWRKLEKDVDDDLGEAVTECNLPQ